MKKILLAVIASLFVSAGFAAKVHALVPEEPMELAEVESTASSPFVSYYSGNRHIINSVHRDANH
jgi:hypothetical protein